MNISNTGTNGLENETPQGEVIHINDLPDLQPTDLGNLMNAMQEKFASEESIDLEDFEDIFGFWEFFKSITSISVPIGLSFTFSSQIFLMSIILNYLNNNEDEAAATNLILTLINVISIIGMAGIYSVTVKAANISGEMEEAKKKQGDSLFVQEKRDEISCTAQNGTLIATCLAAPVIASFLFPKPLLTNVFWQNENVAEITQKFLRTYSLSTLPLMLHTNFGQILFSLNKEKQAMIMSLASHGLGSLIAGALSFGWMGLPKLGSQGVAIGYTIESCVTTISYALFLAYSKDFEKYHFFNPCHTFKSRFKQLLGLVKDGSSMAISETGEMIASLVPSLVAGAIGVLPQGALAATNQFTTIAIWITAAFGQGNPLLVNKEIGAKKYIRANLAGKYGLGATLIYALPIPVFFALFPNLLVINSNDKKKLENILKTLAPIVSIQVIIDAIRYNIALQSRVLNDVIGSTTVSTASLSLGMLLSYILGTKTKLGVNGAVLGSLGGSVLGLTLLSYRWHHRIQPGEIKRIFEPTDEPVSSVHFCNGFFRNCLKKQKEVTQVVDVEQGLLVTDTERAVVNYGSIN